MTTSRRELLKTFAACATFSLVACQRPAIGVAKDKIMQKYTMKTHAVGRFLIDFPESATDISMSQRILATDIVWKSATLIQYRALLSMRLNGLKGTISGKELLISNEAGDSPQSSLLIFEENNRRNGLLRFEYYRFAENINGYFLLSGTADRKKISIIKPSLHDVVKIIQPRIIDSYISDRGICLDHAFIHGAEIEWGETVSIMATLGNITMGFSTQVIEREDDGPSLLQRAEVINGFPEATLLRKSKRTIAGLHGAEFSFIDIPQAASTYSLQWEYPGQVNSIAAPNMEASIGATGPISIPQEELLGLWDVILESIRLRPGAV